MPIRIQCPKCEKSAYFADVDAGLTVGCLGCGTHMVVPVPAPQVKPWATPAHPPAPVPTPAPAAQDHRFVLAHAPHPSTPKPPPAAPSIAPPIAPPMARPPAAAPAPVPAAVHNPAAPPMPPLAPAQPSSKPTSSPQAPAPAPAPSPATPPAPPPHRPAHHLRPAKTEWTLRIAATLAIAGLLLLAGGVVAMIALDWNSPNPAHPRSPATRTAKAGSSTPRSTGLADRPNPPAIAPPPPPALAARAPVGFIALDRLQTSGTILFDSYHSEKGYDESRGPKAIVISNGDVILGEQGELAGTLHIGPAAQMRSGKRIKLSSVFERMNAPLAVPPPATAPFESANDNARLPAAVFQNRSLRAVKRANVSLPGGVYLIDSLVIDEYSTLAFEGPTTLIVRHSVLVIGQLRTSLDRPANLKIRMPASGEFTLVGKQSLCVDFLGPQAAVSISGKGDVFGSIVCARLTVSGARSLHFDESLK